MVQGTGDPQHDVALVPPMAPHGLRNIGDDVLRILGTFVELDRSRRSISPAVRRCS